MWRLYTVMLSTCELFRCRSLWFYFRDNFASKLNAHNFTLEKVLRTANPIKYIYLNILHLQAIFKYSFKSFDLWPWEVFLTRYYKHCSKFTFKKMIKIFQIFNIGYTILPTAAVIIISEFYKTEKKHSVFIIIVYKSYITKNY